MECSNIKNLVSLYIDNQIDEKVRLEFEKHLNSCASCSHELDAISEAVNMLRSIPQTELPTNFKEDLHQKLVKVKEEEKHKRKLFSIKNSYIKALSTVAACALIIFALRGLFFNGVLYKSSADESLNNSMMSESATMAGNSQGIARKTESSKASEGYKQSEALTSGAAETEDNVGVRSFSAASDTSNAEEEINNAATMGKAEVPAVQNRGRHEDISNAAPKESGVATDGIVKVEITINRDVVKAEVVEDIVRNFEIENEMLSEGEQEKFQFSTSKINNKTSEDDITIIEFSIESSSYISLMDKLTTAMEELNLKIEYDNPVLIDEVNLKYNAKANIIIE